MSQENYQLLSTSCLVKCRPCPGQPFFCYRREYVVGLTVPGKPELVSKGIADADNYIGLYLGPYIPIPFFLAGCSLFCAWGAGQAPVKELIVGANESRKLSTTQDVLFSEMQPGRRTTFFMLPEGVCGGTYCTW
jgi:hypothetical protein